MSIEEKPYLMNMWYAAAPGLDIKASKMTGLAIMDQPILVGRDSGGKPFAFLDLCPHRGMQLSKGYFDGEKVTCRFHGWEFKPSGACVRIPSLADKYNLDRYKIRTRSFPCREVQGVIWIYMSDEPVEDESTLPEPFQIPGLENETYKIATPLVFEIDIDNAVFGLLDPAHTPYVHKGILWRTPDTLKSKIKNYEPSDLGFTMVRHPPSSNSVIYKFFGGDPTTEISFKLPGIRLEHIRVGKHHVCNLTLMTPINDHQTQVFNMLYWTNAVMTLARPFLRRFSAMFLGQDQHIIGLQNEALKYNPKMMLINDADMPQRWYIRLKKAWNYSQNSGEPFKNPVEPATLEWKT